MSPGSGDMSTKDDGGPFHCSGTGYPQYYGASLRAVAAMNFTTAFLSRGDWAISEAVSLGVGAADALIAALKEPKQ